MIDFIKFTEYLKSKLPNFAKTSKGGKVLFTCPQSAQHKFQKDTPTMTVVPASDKFYCLLCGLKVTMYDCVRILEEDKKSFSDGQIMEYLINTMDVDAYPEFILYKKYGFSLLPIAKNGKVPLEKGWTDQTHCEKSDWLKWVEQGLNLGIRTGEVSGITVIDADLKVAPTAEFEEIYKELTATKTLTQNSPKGKHFIFKYDKDLKQTAKINGVTIDIRNDGGQILCSPSKINNLSYNWVNPDSDIKEVPENVKAKLLSGNKVDEIDSSKMSEEMTQIIDHPIELVSNNLMGQCNDTFIQFGGALLKMGLPIDKVKGILFYLNKHWLKNPMPSNVIDAMLGSLEGYKGTEEHTQEQAIYEACQLIMMDIGAKDIMEHTQLKRAIVDKILSKFHKEGKLVRMGRGRYSCKQVVEWTSEPQIISPIYPHKIPYFSEVSKFFEGNIILIGAAYGEGKTTIGVNFIKQLKAQGIKPYYIPLESGSSFEEDVKSLGLSCADYYTPKIDDDNPPVNPMQIEIQSRSFTIIDWIDQAEDFAKTQGILKHFNEEMRKKGGILVLFVQIRKTSHEWFAPDLINTYPAFAARFMWDDGETGLVSHFNCDKIRNPLGHYSNARIETEYDFDTKELKKKEVI